MDPTQKVIFITVVVSLTALVILLSMAYISKTSNLTACQEVMQSMLQTSETSGICTKSMKNFVYTMNDIVPLQGMKLLKVYRKEVGVNSPLVDITPQVVPLLGNEITMTTRQLLEMIDGKKISDEREFVLTGWYSN